VGEQPAEPRGRQIVSSLLSHPYVIAIGFLLAAVASLATILQVASDGDDGTPPAAAASPESTPTSNLVTKVSSYIDKKNEQWVVPISAPIEEIPWNGGPACGKELGNWLATYGRPHHDEYFLEVRSAAEGGANMLAVTNVRFGEEVLQQPTEPSFVFTCYHSAPVADVLKATLRTKQDAVALDMETRQPAAFNLAPGEVLLMQLFFRGYGGTYGPIIADVASGTETYQETLIPADDLHLTPAAGLVSVDLAPDRGVFMCGTFGRADARTEPCTADEIGDRVTAPDPG
jgi:hypothetical protein